MIRVTLPGQASGLPAEFACARCWKLKKKCDKVTPRCGRCSTQAATCMYSFLPPKDSVFAFRALDSATGQLVSPSLYSSSNLRGSQTWPYSPIKANSATPVPPQFGHNGSNDLLASQAATVLTTHGVDVEGVCRRYFLTFHRWMSFIPEKEFWLRFFSSQSSTDPELSAMVLTMYLIASPPAKDNTEEEFVEFVYSIAKNSWTQLQTTSQPSVLLIQTGLLLATYENGQALQGESRSSMGACVSMGYTMNLHLSIKQNIILASGSQADLFAQRRLWWAIVMLERLLSAKNLETGCHFESQHPTQDDYLPLGSGTTSYKTSDDKFMAVATKYGPEQSDIAFADVPPYCALAQAIYLFSRVSEHIINPPSEAQSQETAASLDIILRDFAGSLLRQAAGQSLNGNYCTSFFTSIISLVALHRYEISRRESSGECSSADSPSDNLLAIIALTRIFRETSRKRLNSGSVVPHVQPYDIYVIYLGVALHVEVTDRSDEVDWQEDLQQMIGYLQQLEKKWKIAGVYLELIARILEKEVNHTQSSI